MWVEIVERMLKEKDLEIKQRELKKYWTKRGLFYEDSSEEEKDEVVKEIINFYNDNYEGTQIGEFILELEKQGFSTERVHLDGNRKVKRQSKRQMMKTMLPESNKQASWNEGFKMSYSFANENMPSQEDEIELDIDLTELDRIDKEVEDLGNNNIQNGGDKK